MTLRRRLIDLLDKPALPPGGWSWFDALSRYAPNTVRQMGLMPILKDWR